MVLATIEETQMKAHVLASLVVVGWVVGVVGHLSAHEGHEHKVMGTVTMAAPDHVMLKDTTNKDVTIKVTKDTHVKSKPPMKVEAIKPGTRVVVTAVEEKDARLTAKIIEVGVTPAPSK
jgi:hypothetical protein